MKKRLICFSVLASFIIGLVLVGSCKDYDDFALDIRVQNLENRVASDAVTLADTLDSIKNRLARIKQCTCDPTIKGRVEKIESFIGVMLSDTASVDSSGTPIKGISQSLNYINRQLSLLAAQTEVDNLKARIDKLYKDSIQPAYAEAKWVADSLRNMRFGIGDSIRKAQDTASMAYVLASQNKIDITLLKKYIPDSINALQDSLRNHLARIEALEARRPVHTYYDSLRHAVQRADSNKVSIDSLAQITTQLIVKDSVLNSRIDSLAKVTFKDSVRIDELIVKDSVLNSRIDSLAKVTYNDSIRTKEYLDSALNYTDTVAVHLYDSIGKVVKAYQAADAAIWATLSPIVDSVRDVYDSLKVHRTAINALSDSIDAHRQVFNELFDSIAAHRKEFNSIYDSIHKIDSILKVHELRIDTLNNRVDTLELKVDSLKDAKDKFISNVIIQGTKNDVFGSFALPINVKSNVLMAYYSTFPGKSFPTYLSSGLKGSVDINEDDWAVIKGGKEDLNSGTVIGESSDNAGKLYFTLNPNDVKIDNTYEFYLINSLGDKTPVTLSNIRKPTEALTFGYTAAKGASQVIEDDINTVNGFYQADVKIEASDAYSLRPNLDKEALKAVASDIKNYSDGIDLKSLASTLLKSVDGILEAKALYVTWEDMYGKHSATSGYDLAVTAISPLSYNTFNSLPLPSIFDKKIPENPIQYLLTKFENKAISEANKIKLTFKPFTISNIDFEIPDVTFDSATADKSIVIYIKAQNGYKDTITVPFTKKSSQDYREPLCEALEALETVIGLTHDEACAVINNMRKQIEKQANKILSSIQGTVRSKVKTAIGDITTEVGNNKYVKKVEKLANRLASYYNNIGGVEGLGRYLVEPTMLYLDDSGNLHPMSGSSLIPTPFTGSQVDLVLTSLTNEIITPAYKKFVAVTNYTDPSTYKDYQNEVDEAAKNAVKDFITSINGNGEIGVVLDGDTRTVTFNAPKKGIYELLLSTIDYDGYVYNRKFYVNVQ